MTDVLRVNKDKKKRNLFYMVLAVAVLFATFIALSGATHVLQVFELYFPTSESLSVVQSVLHIFCAILSVATAIFTQRLLPIILQSLDHFELNSEGNLRHAENYMIEVVEMVKESILVLTESFQVVRCNHAANVLLGFTDCMGLTYTNSIHPDDLKLFHASVNCVMHGFQMDSVTNTIEYRVKQSSAAARSIKPPLYKVPSRCGNAKVLPINESFTSDAPSEFITPQNAGIAGQSFSASVYSLNTSALGSGSSESSDRYIWVESTICKGVRLNRDEDFVYEIKLVTRNIEDRKREAVREYKEIIRETEERDRTNAAKLRYISCIAHDLKTPLQSFCFTLDLLNQTNMYSEQSEYVNQANVAVDLMKLTISQTMDISKALTGAKLMPRRTTVYLSLILQRVEIIM